MLGARRGVERRGRTGPGMAMRRTLLGLAASGREKAPGGEDVDCLSGSEVGRVGGGVGQVQAVQEFAAVAFGEDREVVDAGC